MADIRVANRVIHGLTRRNVLSLTRECVEGLGYWATPIFLADDGGNSSIALFSKNLAESFTDTLSPSVGTVVITAQDAVPGVYVQIYCMKDWYKLTHFIGFTPCEVGVALMRW